MSRIEEGDCDDNESFLRACAFEGNIRRAINGRKGQAILLELEEALLALPEKRLVHGVIARTEEHLETQPGDPPVSLEGDVCALGCLALHREMKGGLSRERALKKITEAITSDPDDNGWEAISQASNFLNIVRPLAWEIVSRNDEYGGSTQEETYQKVLRWVQRHIRRGKGWGGL